MARSRRRMARPPRKRQRRSDWVYRSSVFDVGGGIIDDLGTYQPFTKTLVAGIANANAAVLYDSHNYTAATVVGQFDTPRIRVWAPARAEGGKAKIHMVEGTLILRPSTWTVGSVFGYGIRFGIFEQDPQVGSFLIDPAYTMWGGGVAPANQPANWANDRMWQFERRFFQTFATANDMTSFTMRFRFRVNRSLNANMCYGIYSESSSGSATLTEQMWFRTLVSDEG